MVHSLSPPVCGHETTLHVLRQNQKFAWLRVLVWSPHPFVFLIVVGKDVDDNPADSGIFAETEISVGLEQTTC